MTGSRPDLQALLWCVSRAASLTPDSARYLAAAAALDQLAKAVAPSLVSLVPGAQFDDKLRKIPPHLVLNSTEDTAILRKEIFGPLFPIKTYDNLDEVLAYLNSLIKLQKEKTAA